MPSGIQLLLYLIKIVSFIIMLDVAISWLMMFNSKMNHSHPFVKLVHSLSNPILNPIRRIMPHPSRTGNFDLSPVVVLVALQFIQFVVLGY